jgi:heat shock protein 4
MESQDWLYDEGEDASKGVYIAKIDELRALAGPIRQRYLDKVEADRQAVQARVDAERAAKKAAEEEAKKAAGGAETSEAKDEEMTDADAPKPETEEMD